eukprot:554273_1
MTAIDALSFLINTFDNHYNKQPLCICSNSMVPVPRMQNLQGLHHCDSCGKNVTDNQHPIFWHCPQEWNVIHPDGYDICNICHITGITGITGTQITNKHASNGTEVTVYMDEHKEKNYCEQNTICSIPQKFVDVMQQYNENSTNMVKNMDNTQLSLINNYFLHLLFQHDTDDQFEIIYKMLGDCDIAQCDMYIRNNRNRLCHISEDAFGAEFDFKQELIQNPFAPINIDLYKGEYRKAQIKLASKYCKTNHHFQSHDQKCFDDVYQVIHWKFKLEYIMAMMLYCNYTALQYAFSKTYRENRGNNHKYFYFWGMYLKICMQ